VLDSVQAMSLLTIMEIVGPLLLLAALIYGTVQWSRRRRGPTQAVREASTRQLYREGAKAEAREAGPSRDAKGNSVAKTRGAAAATRHRRRPADRGRAAGRRRHRTSILTGVSSFAGIMRNRATTSAGVSRVRSTPAETRGGAGRRNSRTVYGVVIAGLGNPRRRP
jgi:hypothetical protein